MGGKHTLGWHTSTAIRPNHCVAYVLSAFWLSARLKKRKLVASSPIVDLKRRNSGLLKPYYTLLLTGSWGFSSVSRVVVENVEIDG